MGYQPALLQPHHVLQVAFVGCYPDLRLRRNELVLTASVPDGDLPLLDPVSCEERVTSPQASPFDEV